jgi:cytochrome c oxidase subunit IV
MSMAQGHDSIEGEGHKHHGPTLTTYLSVAGALAVFTASSFIFNEMVRHGMISSMTGLALIMVVAVCKAILVGAFFMHLTYDWSKLYYLIIPALILGVMMMLVLMPDFVVAPHKVNQFEESLRQAKSAKP